MSLFTTFGTFSIAAGMLLIFLIFVMLAAERRSELGIARAVGTRRGAPRADVRLRGPRVRSRRRRGRRRSRRRRGLRDGARAGERVAATRHQIAYSVKPASLVLAYAIGVLLTLGVVAFSAWRVSRMNIVSAIRDLPEPAASGGAGAAGSGRLVGIVLGAAARLAGVQAEDAVVLGVGVSLVILSLVPLLRARGVPDRRLHTARGSRSSCWFVLPIAAGCSSAT